MVKMNNSRIPSPARSQGANLTPRRPKPRVSRSVGSPARSNVSGRLTSVIEDYRDYESFKFSPLINRKSVLNDNTNIEEPRRASWWRKLDESTRNVIEVMNAHEAVDAHQAIDEYVDILSQEKEKQNFSLDLPDSSDNESINSIVIPQRKLFTQKDMEPKNFEQIMGTRETLARINKTNNELHNKSVKVTKKNLFGQGVKRSRPAFPDALLNISLNKTVANKTKELAAAEVQAQPKSLFGNRPGVKRKNMFVDFVVSESEDEIPDIEPKVFAFPKKPKQLRSLSISSRASSINADVEMDDWKMLPSSTMVDNLMEDCAGDKETALQDNEDLHLHYEEEVENQVDKPTFIEKDIELKEYESKQNKTLSKLQSDIVNETQNKLVKKNNSKLSTSKIKSQQKSEDKQEKPEKKASDDCSIQEQNVSQNITKHLKITEIKKINQRVDQQGDNQIETNNKDIENRQNQSHDKSKSRYDNDKNLSIMQDEENVEGEDVDKEGADDKKLEDEKAQEEEVEEQNESQEVLEQLEQSNIESEHEQKLDQIGADEKVFENSVRNDFNVNHSNKEESKQSDDPEQKDEEDVNDGEEQNESLAESEKLEQSKLDLDVEESEKRQDLQVEEDQSDDEEMEQNDEQNESNQEVEMEQNDNDQEESNQEEVEMEQTDDDQESNQEEIETEQDGDQDKSNQEEVQIEQTDDDQDESNQEEVEIEQNDNDLEESNQEVEIEQNDSNEEESNQEEVEMEQDDDQEESNREEEESHQEDIETNDEEIEDSAQNQSLVSNESDTENREPEESTPNVSHDTTGRNRNLHKSPEAVLQHNASVRDSSITKGRNTSSRKTKSMINNLNIKPSLAPVRESIGFSDGKDSSAEGSGWDSHRTTRKTIRQTMGKGFSPRKSLRALVMEKSAKRYTVASEFNDDISKIPQANSTEFPDAIYGDESEMNIDVEEPVHEVSKRTRQATLEMYLQSIKRKNMQTRLQLEEDVKNSLKNTKEAHSFFKKPSKTFALHKANSKTQQKQPKPKVIKSTIIPLEDLPENLLKDLQYKPPKRYKPGNAAWITKRLYNFLESKLEPKYEFKSRIRAERLVETIYNFTKDMRRHPTAPRDAVEVLKREMARLNIVQTHFDFYNFFHEYMPREIRVKVVPDVVNKIALPKNGVFTDIIVA